MRAHTTHDTRTQREKSTPNRRHTEERDKQKPHTRSAKAQKSTLEERQINMHDRYVDHGKEHTEREQARSS